MVRKLNKAGLLLLSGALTSGHAAFALAIGAPADVAPEQRLAAAAVFVTVAAVVLSAALLFFVGMSAHPKFAGAPSENPDVLSSAAGVLLVLSIPLAVATALSLPLFWWFGLGWATWAFLRATGLVIALILLFAVVVFAHLARAQRLRMVKRAGQAAVRRLGHGPGRMAHAA